MKINLKKLMKRQYVLEVLFLVFLLWIYCIWARVQPLSGGPDEQMRYQICQYIYEHGSIPAGDDPAVRNPVWGISYAFFPVLAYMWGALFMKIMSIFTTAPFALLMAARFSNMLLGIGMAFIVRRIGNRLFDSRYKSWVLTAFVSLMPGCTFIFTYVNNDGLALFSTAVIVYAWICGIQDGWTYRNCIILGLGVGLCGLSYYNAYGFILCSVLLFGITLLMEYWKPGQKALFVKKGSLVCAIALLIVGWWFIRNYMLYDGDILAREASTLCAEMYAKEGYKPSGKLTPQSEGYTFWQMLTQPYGGPSISWIEIVSRSFVGRFGHMNIKMPNWTENNYMDFIKVGFLLMFLHPVRMFRIRKDGVISKKAVFNWVMLIAMIIPNILNAYYSYFSDYQPQGRYSLPMLIPLAYFMITGYETLFDKLIENERIRNGVYVAVGIILMVLVFAMYATVIYPAFKTDPPGLQLLIGGGI